MSEWPSNEEIARACRNLWTGNQFQHIQTVHKVLAEVKNMRGVK